MAVTLPPALGAATRPLPSMEKFVIEGGVPLSGTIVPAGNKNAALPLLACALLTEDEVVLHNVPRIRDTAGDDATCCARPRCLGRAARGQHRAPQRRRRAVARRSTPTSPSASAPRSCVAGPLLARFGAALMPPPGGDVIGRRRLDPHLDAFMRPRCPVEHAPRDPHRGARRRPAGVDFFMDEPSVMGTENALMAAALTPGTTIIRNAACEPHVQDLARMLVRMGAAIEGIGSNVMTVHGRRRARRLRAHRLARPHRDRLVHGARRRHRRRAAHQGHRARTTCA